MTRPDTRERAREPQITEQGVRHRRQATSGSHAPRLAAVAATLITAALVIATGAIHLYLYHLSYSAVPTIGRLFLVNAVAALVLGVLIVALRSPWWSLIGAAFCLGTLGAFLVSVHWGLFGFQETLHGTWQERAAVVELAGAAAGVIASLLIWHRQRSA